MSIKRLIFNIYYTNTAEYKSTLKSNETQKHAIAWKNVKNVSKSDVSL